MDWNRQKNGNFISGRSPGRRIEKERERNGGVKEGTGL